MIVRLQTSIVKNTYPKDRIYKIISTWSFVTLRSDSSNWLRTVVCCMVGINKYYDFYFNHLFSPL